MLTREVAAAEGIAGGFSAVYDVLKALEDAGRIRRGYFASGVGATQFALPAALDLLRSLKEPPDDPEVVVLSATDPANPYGTILKWPDARTGDDRGPRTDAHRRIARGHVNGALAAYISRGARQLLVFLPEDEPARSTVARALATRLAQLARGEEAVLALLIGEINGVPASEHPLAPYLVEAGFSPSAMGLSAYAGAVGRARGGSEHGSVATPFVTPWLALAGGTASRVRGGAVRALPRASGLADRAGDLPARGRRVRRAVPQPSRGASWVFRTRRSASRSTCLLGGRTACWLAGVAARRMTCPRSR